MTAELLCAGCPALAIRIDGGTAWCAVVEKQRTLTARCPRHVGVMGVEPRAA